MAGRRGPQSASLSLVGNLNRCSICFWVKRDDLHEQQRHKPPWKQTSNKVTAFSAYYCSEFNALCWIVTPYGKWITLMNKHYGRVELEVCSRYLRATECVLPLLCRSDEFGAWSCFRSTNVIKPPSRSPTLTLSTNVLNLHGRWKVNDRMDDGTSVSCTSPLPRCVALVGLTSPAGMSHSLMFHLDVHVPAPSTSLTKSCSRGRGISIPLRVTPHHP